jgi:hypothetical protein
MSRPSDEVEFPSDVEPDDPRLAADATVDQQVRALDQAVHRNSVARAILERAPELRLDSWYLGAGGVTQTVWNLLHGFEPTRGIKDYDLVYFDRDDLSVAGEEAAENRAAQLFEDLDAELDVTNEARVHLWYPERFGRSIPPYCSTEHAISTWPTTASSIGVRSDNGAFVVCAPFGLSDLYAMVVRANKAIIDQAIYEAKAQRWAETWPKLSVIPW